MLNFDKKIDIVNKHTLHLFLIYILIVLIKNINAQSQLPTPVFSIGDTVITNLVEVTIAVPESCIVYLTTDGNMPTREDERYFDGSILRIDSSVTITAKAFKFYWKTGEKPSLIWEDGGYVTATYIKILEQPYVALTPISGDSVNVEIYCRDRNVDLYYTTDGSLPDFLSNKYFDIFHVPSNIVLKVIAIKKGSISSRIVTISGPKVEVYRVCNRRKINEKSDEKCILLNGKTINGGHNKKSSAAYGMLINKNKLTKQVIYRKY